MNAKEFYDRTVAMREAQKLYFRCRTTEALKKAQRLEREIDDEIKRVQEVLRQRELAKQATLFDAFDLQPPQ